jgi:hypothetical protein
LRRLREATDEPKLKIIASIPIAFERLVDSGGASDHAERGSSTTR